LNKFLSQLIDVAESRGLNDRDILLAKEYLSYHEFELCFDTLVTQMYEYTIKINQPDYALISAIAERLKLASDKFEFMHELVALPN
jgi:hypothetical protein